MFWDIIYSNPEKGTGIFISKFQDAPLDLYSDFFYINRKDKIDDRLKNIQNGWETFEEVVEFMKNIFDARKEGKCYIYKYSPFTQLQIVLLILISVITGEVSLFNSNLEWCKIHEIITCLGRNGLHCICKRLSQSYHYFHSGFPDLTVWNYSTKKVLKNHKISVKIVLKWISKFQIKFVEVKGDGDKLSNKQIQWMTYLLSNGIETEVCYVHKGLQKRKIPKKNLNKTDSQEKKTVRRKRNLNIEKDVEQKSTKKKKCSKSNSFPEKKTCDLSNVEMDNPKPEFSGCTMSQNTTRKPILKSPSNDKSPKKNFKYSPKKLVKSQSFSECYLKSPTKFCKGVGYYVSPSKSLPNSQSPKKNNNSHEKSQIRKRLSLSLTRRRIFEKDL